MALYFMAEGVQTGGLKKFEYTHREIYELEPERRDDIRKAYTIYDSRRKKEKRNRVKFWIILCIIVLILVGFFIYQQIKP